jgi:WS/DGAT/MGAT family acyltransferase
VANPAKVIDALAALGSPDNRLINDWASVSKMVLPPKMPETCWTGTPGEAKTLSWISGADLAAVAAASKRAGASINDTMLSLIGAGLHDYLAQHGDTRTEDLLWIIPVTLKPLDPSAPPELGNHVALMSLALPVAIEDAQERVTEIRTRMLRLKHSDEAAILLGLQKIVGVTPAVISSRIVDMVANRHVGVITNVPGPRAPMSLAGTEVAGVMGWNPMSGNQPITMCIFSYNGTVSVGFSTDNTLIPDPDVLVAAVRRQLVDAGLLAAVDG